MSTLFEVFDGPDAVALAAADRFEACVAAAVAARGHCDIALAGGSTPERLYRLLATRSIPWERCRVFFSDDRFVPTTDLVSNAGLALGLLPLGAAQVFPIPVEGIPSAEAAGVLYEQVLCTTLGEVPRFDLILLGMGDDGHTASLFPGKPALAATGWVTHSTPGVLPPPVDRVTFTFATLNAARAVLFLVTGTGKAPKVADWQAGRGTVETLPVLGVAPTEGSLTVLLDRAAAGA